MSGQGPEARTSMPTSHMIFQQRDHSRTELCFKLCISTGEWARSACSHCWKRIHYKEPSDRGGGTFDYSRYTEDMLFHRWVDFSTPERGVEENRLKRCLKGVKSAGGWTQALRGGGGFVLV